MRELSAQVRGSADAAEDSLGQIERAVFAYLRFLDERPNFVELLIQERAEFKDRRKPTYFEHRRANLDRWRQLVERLIAEGRVRPMPVDLVLDVLNDVLYGCMFTNYFAEQERPLEQQASEILEIVFHGILTDQERRRRKEDRGLRCGSVGAARQTRDEGTGRTER